MTGILGVSGIKELTFWLYTVCEAMSTVNPISTQI
jgi:hypothetical protein